MAGGIGRPIPFDPPHRRKGMLAGGGHWYNARGQALELLVIINDPMAEFAAGLQDNLDEIYPYKGPGRWKIR